MARSSTSERDLHKGLVARLRAGESISTAKIPSHRLAPAAAVLRKEGIEVLQEKVVTNPGKFPAIVRSVYRVASAPTTNGNAPAQAPESGPVREGPVTPDVRRRLIAGEHLTVARVVADYGCNKSTLSQVVVGLRRDGYLIDVLKSDGGPSAYACATPKPMGRRPKKPKQPKWVAEAEAEEAAELEPNPYTDEMAQAAHERVKVKLNGLIAKWRAPRLFSIVSKTEIIDGEVVLTILDGDESFTARLHSIT